MPAAPANTAPPHRCKDEMEVTTMRPGALILGQTPPANHRTVLLHGHWRMSSLKFLFMIGTALTTSAGAALAQTAPAPAPAQTPPPSAQAAPDQDAPPPEDSTELEQVVVTGRTTDVRTSIDSTSYSLAEDLQAQTGSLADALRNIPSVDVDPQGNVSLRGDGNVTILVDGRPSGVLQGEGRAQAILQLPADRYARIEVMTNPSAAYSPEGSGGVINLITKPNQPRQGIQSTGSIRANVGDHGRWNAGFSGSRQDGALTLSGDLNVRHDAIEQAIDRVRERLDPATGALISTADQTLDVDAEADGRFGRLSAEYQLDDKTQLTAEVRAAQFENAGEGLEQFVTRDASGTIISALDRIGQISQEGENFGVTGRFLRRFDDQGHEWTTELRVDTGSNATNIDTLIDPSVPAGADSYERISNGTNFTLIGFTSAYVRPMGEAKLRAGYELDIRKPEIDNAVLRGASPDALTPDPTVTNAFEAEQTVHALYATYERPFGEKLSAQFGLRLEQADIELDQITTGVTASQDYFRAYPTMHVQYQLTDAQLLRASYSRRIQRPQPFQLNPFTAYQDPLNLRSGNPDLEPQETDAFEAMWQMRQGQTFYQATAYYRDTQKAFTDVTSDLGGGVFLTRPENLGARRDLGVELVANGRLHPTLRYNASVNAFRQEIDAGGILGGRDREGEQVNGRLSLNWQPTSADFLQIAGFWQGEQLLAQGVRESGGMLNLGYRRTLTEKLAFQATVRDVFDEMGDVTTFDTPQFHDRVERKFGGRAAYIGLTWSLGSGPRRQQDPQFDFSAPQAGG